MPVLQKEVGAVYGGCEITQIDANRLRVLTSRNSGDSRHSSMLFTLVPQAAEETLIKVTVLVVTPQGPMAVPWSDGSKEFFLKSGVFDQTKAGAEAPKG